MSAARKTEKSGKNDKAKNTRKKRPAPVRETPAREPLLTDSRRRIIRIVLGVLCGILTLYTLAALLSYVFTWTSDQSLAFNPQMFSLDTAAENAGGKIGYLWANLLISKWFGLGAFAIPAFLAFLTVYCFRIKKVNLLRVFLLCAFGAIIFSVLLAYIFGFTSFDSMFGSGAGGSYGHYANRWLCDKLGKAGTAGVLVAVLFLYACLLTPKAAFWLDDLIYGISHREPKTDPDTVPDDLETDEDGETYGLHPGLVVEGAEEADTDPTDDWLDYAGTDTDPESPAGPGTVDVIRPEEPETGDEADEGTGSVSGAEDVPLTIEGKSESDIIAGLSDEEWRERYDPRLDLPRYKLPPMSLLNDYKEMWYEVSRQELENNKQRIVNALNSYKIRVKGITAKMGPTVTLYKIQLDDGIKVSQVRNLEEDIAISLGAKGVRVVTLLDSVGIEVANVKPSVVALKSVLGCQQFQEASQKMELPMAIGITVTNEPFFLDLAKMPHLLVAGATGQGKSVGLNVMITSLLYSKHPAEMKMVLVDPKKVEFSLYEKLDKHYLAMLPDGDEAIITDTKKVANTLNSLCIEMDARYDLLKKADVRQLKEYNEKFLSRRLNPNNGHKFLPYIVVIIDEFGDLLMTAGREIENPIARLAQKARAVGIHLIIATQRPTVNIITGSIKANFNSRIAFKVNTGTDSKVIIDAPGANRLIGRGDMLVVYPGHDLTRVQCALVDTPEIIDIVKFISQQRGYAGPFELPEYVDPNDEEGGGMGDVDLHKRDQLFEECARMVVQYQQGSTSMLQRKLNVGYARAGRIMDQLEAAGIVGPQEGSKARSVLVTDLDSLDRILESLNHI
ncbi:MAG: DNA translocase FtsK 4TM domain-containing protein [Bacteroidales bacterium]|nr:DNA translocase FtsK 4TM domain-containing protein [Bacteroidales bacterium]